MTAVVITLEEAAGVERYERDGVTQLEINDVVKLLGVSRQVVQKLLNTNQLPHFKVGPITKIPIAGFKKYIAKAMAGN